MAREGQGYPCYQRDMMMMMMMIYIYITWYRHWVSCITLHGMTLGFMHSAIVEQSEDLKKNKTLISLIFWFEKWGLFVCMCA